MAKFTGNYKDDLPELFFRRFMSRVKKETSGCWRWTGATFKSGYGRVKSGGKMLRAHRVSFELFAGPVPTGLNVLHSCDNKLCVNPDHLEAGTQKKNMEDASSRGLVSRRTLTQEQAESILRDPHNKTRTFVAGKAVELKVHPRAIRRVLLGQTWKFLHAQKARDLGLLL